MRFLLVLRLVLVGLVAFFFVTNLFLNTFHERFVEAIATERTQEWAAEADRVASLLAHVDRPDRVEESLAVLDTAREQHPRLSVVTISGNGRAQRFVLRPAAGDLIPIAVALGDRRVTLFFEGTSIAEIQRLIALTRWNSIAGVVSGILLVLTSALSLVRDPPPPRRRKEESADDGSIEILSATISTLKGRAEELGRMTTALTHNITSGYLSFDREARLFDANDAAREILGIEGAVRGRLIEDVTALSEFTDQLETFVRKRVTAQRVEMAHTVNGVEKTIGLTTVPLFEAHGEHVGSIALFTDLTPIRRLELRVRERQVLADLGEISAGVAHEFRNSLSTILGYLKLARRSEDAAQAGAKLNAAEQEALNLSASVDSLLQFSRPIALREEKVDASATLAEMADRLLALEPDVQLHLDLEPILITGDSAVLSRAFENLLRNAVEAIREAAVKGEIRLTATQGPPARITIEDNGTGLDSADAARLLLPFTTTKASGTGMGLPIARKVLMVHGARLELRGERGRGTVAEIEFDTDLPSA